MARVRARARTSVVQARKLLTEAQRHAASLALGSLPALLLAPHLWGAGLWPLGLLLLWTALALQLVAAAYVAGETRVFGKGSDGRLGPAQRLVLLPFLLLVALTRQVYLRAGREPEYDEVAPGVIVGRPATELPPGVTQVLDLTAELDEPRVLADHVGYRCLPTLDGTPPDVAQLLDILRGYSVSDVCFLHCAAGHGRSAFAAALLLALRGVEGSAAELVSLMQRSRPGVALNRTQLAVLDAALVSARSGS